MKHIVETYMNIVCLQQKLPRRYGRHQHEWLWLKHQHIWENMYFNTDNRLKMIKLWVSLRYHSLMSYILVYLLYCDSGVRGGEPSSSGGVSGTIFLISGVGGGGPGGVRGPGGSADIGVLGASRGERPRSVLERICLKTGWEGMICPSSSHASDVTYS